MTGWPPHARPNRRALSLSRMRRSRVCASGMRRERLSQAHQRHAFRARKREFLHQRFDAEHLSASAPDFGYQPGREALDARRCGRVEAGFLHQRRHANGLRRPVRGGDGGAPGWLWLAAGARDRLLRDVLSTFLTMAAAGTGRACVLASNISVRASFGPRCRKRAARALGSRGSIIVPSPANIVGSMEARRSAPAPTGAAYRAKPHTR